MFKCQTEKPRSLVRKIPLDTSISGTAPPLWVRSEGTWVAGWVMVGWGWPGTAGETHGKSPKSWNHWVEKP